MDGFLAQTPTPAPKAAQPDGAYSTPSSPGGEIAAQEGDEGGESSEDDHSSGNGFNVGDAIGLDNITHLLDAATIGQIALDCVTDFRIDDNNFKPRRERIEELYKLAMQAKEIKNYPFENASNVKYPLLTKAALSFAALAYPAIVKDNTVVKAMVIGNDDGGEVIEGGDGKPMMNPNNGKPMRKNAGIKRKRADRVATFMSYQILDDMDGWEDDMDKLLHIIPIIGCAFKKSYRDPIMHKNVSRLVLPQFLIVNQDAKTMESAFRSSELVEFYPNEIESNIRSGLFREFNFSMQSTETLATGAYRKSDAPQASVSAQDADLPHQFIEMHRWYDLDGDGYQEPYIVWIHKQTNEVARIMARYEAEDIIAGDVEQSADGSAVYRDIKVIKAECYYEKFGFIPDPEGSIYDIGFGHLLQHINEAANTSINQLIDAGHRNIMGGGFIGNGLRIKSGDMRFRPAEWKRVDTQGRTIADNVFPLPMPAPSTVLLELMEFLVNAAESIAIMTKAIGDMPAGMTATTALAQVEQGLQPFKAVFKRIHRALKSEFKRLYKLNQKYLTQEEYNAVLDDPDASVEKDFGESAVYILPVSDPDMVNNIEMILRAQILEQYKDDPLIDPVECRTRIFTAVNIKDVDDLIKIPPKVPDELVEAQKAALMAQTQQAQAEVEKLNRDNERADIMTALKIEETMAGIQQKVSQAVLNIAQAEEAEKGLKLDVFMANLKALETRINGYATIAGANKQLAQPSNNIAGSQVSE